MAERIFLGGKELFPVAVACKLAALKPGMMPDFSRIMVVLPGKIARQNVQKELLKSFPGGLLLPQLTTPHGLLYAGFGNPGEIVSAAAEDILWGRAVKKALEKKEHFQNIFRNGAFPADPFSAGRIFSRLRKELTAGNLSVSEAAGKLGIRGKELALLESFFLEELSAAGFSDQLSLDRQAAADTGYFAGVEKVILAGLPDLPEIIRQKSSAIDAAFPGKVEVWINNSPEDENIFDKWGRPLPDFWLNRAWQGTKENIHVALNPVDAARRAALLAAGDSGVFSSGECAVVLADPALYKDFAREFSKLKDLSGTPLVIADPSGIPMKLQRLWQLLRKAADHLQNPGDFFPASELLRDRDYLLYALNEDETPGTTLALLDDFQQQFTPDDFNFARKLVSGSRHYEVIDRLFSRLVYWQNVFAGSSVVEFLRKFLTAVYLKRENIESEIFNGISFAAECDLVNSHINKLENLPDLLKNSVNKIELLEIFLHNLGNEHLIQAVPEGALIFEGRLEMPFLEQKKIIFCGMNEGFFPDVIQTTAFLTDSIRSELGIRSNRETLLRSVCHLFSTKSGRGENDLQLIVLRQDSEKSTLKPSGILFNGDLDNNELLDRCQYLFADPAAVEVSKTECAGKSFKLKLPLDCRRTDDGTLLLRVTDIDQYLISPFEFFWSRVLGNNPVDYSRCEPDAALAGTLIHAAFEELGSESFATAEKLREKLVGNFQRIMHRRYGEELPLLVKLFAGNVIQRLEYAADVLFAEELSGFRVLKTEYPFGGSENGSLHCYGAVFRGKIDRIEYNPAEKTVRIVDIKTGKVDNVVSDHYSRTGGRIKFKKLQLPLYAMLLKKDEFFRRNILPEIDECRIECAYLTIPRSVTDSCMAIWKSDELSSILPEAESELLRIIDEIRELPQNKLYMEPRKINSPWLKPNAVQALYPVDFVQDGGERDADEKEEDNAVVTGKKSGKKNSTSLPAETERVFETLPEKKSAAGCTRCCDCPEKISSQCNCFHGDCVSCKSFNGFKSFNLITASAGTGKTYSLASRFIQLLEYGVPPESIMAVTFTKKAAGEIFDRIISRICDMIKNPDKAENFCRRHPAGDLPVLLRQMVGSRNNELQISTIDSFFMRIMQSFAPEFGIWGEISLIDENDDRYRRRTLRKWLKSLDNSEEQNTLRELIKDADNSEAGEIYASLVSLVNSIYAYFQHNIEVAPDKTIPQIALPVFQLPATDVMKPDECRDMIMRLREFALNIEVLAVPGSNKRSVATLGKRLNALAEALEKSIAGYFFHRLSDDVKALIEALNKKNPDVVWCDAGNSDALGYVIELPEGLPGLLRKSMRHIRALAAYQARRKTLAVFEIISKFDSVYSTSVRNSGKLTFADLPAMLLAMDPDARMALLGPADHSLEMRLDSRFDHYMLDEFQDTSDAQMLALDPLFSEIFSTGNQGERFRSFFCVGDLKQSIYQWRGGNPELFNFVANKLKILGNAAGYDPVDSLNLSYRSSRIVLDTVNAVFAPYSGSMPGFAEVLEKFDYRTHRTAREELSGHSAVFEVPQSRDEDDTIAAKAGIIMQIVKEVQPFERELTVGILVQDNKFARRIAAALRNLTAIPVSIDGRISVSERMIFNVFKALLTLALHPGDVESASFLEMLTVISPDGSEKIITPGFLAEKLNWNKNVSLPEAAAEALFYGKLSGFTAGFSAAFGRECGEADNATMDVLCRAAENFSGTPEEFLQQLDKYGETGRSVNNTIQIMTYHKSKGLEFDMVFLPQTGNRKGNHNKLTPDAPAVHYYQNDENCFLHRPEWVAYRPVDVISELIPPFAAKSREEKFSSDFEKCCNLYVAMTRAKRALYMLLSCSGTSSTLALDKLLQERLSAYGVCNADFELEKEFNIPGNSDMPVKVTFSRGNRHWYSETPFSGQMVFEPVVLPVVKMPEKEMVVRASDGKDELFVPPAERRFTGFSAKDTGTEVHDIFSRIGFISENFDAAEFSAGASDEAQKIFISAMEKSSPIRDALKNPGGDVEVWLEKRFILRDKDGSVVPGAFDRVSIFRNGGKITHAEIVDYKSDNFKSLKDCYIYAGQLEKYRQSLAVLLGIEEKNIRCKIYALKLKKIVEIVQE